ncbi:hypothetical protein MUK42_05127 [Musa troglodytarum]|nr:hypothetical protein MUK42_05127 [Musa troglodytarum]
MDSFNKILFLNKNLFFDLFHLLHDRNKRGYILHDDFKSKKDILRNDRPIHSTNIRVRSVVS